ITDPTVFTAKGFVPPKEVEVDTSYEQGKELLGFLLIVPQGTTKKVAFSYSQKNAVDLKQQAFSYDLKIFKQPGTQDDPYNFSLVYPEAFQLVTADRQLTNVGGKLVYSDNLSEDTEVTAEFSRK